MKQSTTLTLDASHAVIAAVFSEFATPNANGRAAAALQEEDPAKRLDKLAAVAAEHGLTRLDVLAKMAGHGVVLEATTEDWVAAVKVEFTEISSNYMAAIVDAFLAYNIDVGRRFLFEVTGEHCLLSEKSVRARLAQRGLIT